MLTYRVNVTELGQLRPGRDPGLDVICDGILKSTPFVYCGDERS
jgi:hypothetical protein